MIPPVPVATHETKPDIISSGAGLAAAVALESGPGLGEGTEPVRARGYWEQVWIRFRKDKIAIAGGVFIILIILAGFIGAPIAAHILGHGPGDLFTYGLDPNTQLPVGPMTHISLAPYVARRAISARRCSCSAATASSAGTSSCACSTAPRSRSRWRSLRRCSACSSAC